MTWGQEGCASKHTLCWSRWCVKNKESQVVCFVVWLLAHASNHLSAHCLGCIRFVLLLLGPCSLILSLFVRVCRRFCVFIFDFFARHILILYVRGSSTGPLPIHEAQRFGAAELRDISLASKEFATQTHQSKAMKEIKRKRQRETKRTKSDLIWWYAAQKTSSCLSFSYLNNKTVVLKAFKWLHVNMLLHSSCFTLT